MSVFPFGWCCCYGPQQHRLATLNDLDAAERRIIHHLTMKLSELGTKLASYGDTLTKIQAEVQALKDSINNADVEVPQSIVDSVAKIDGLLTSIDQLNPDVTDVGTGTGTQISV